jgi:hypothetical protein
MVLLVGLFLVPMGCLSASNNGGGGGAGGGSAGAGIGGRSGTAGAGAGGTTSGVGGRGGAAGVAGATGAGGGAGAPGGSGGAASGPCGVSGQILCDDFESDPVGMEPSGGPWLAREAGCPASNPVPLVDTAQAYNSARALASTAIPYDACSLHADIGTPADYWVRARVRFGTGADFSFHEVTVFELAPSADTDDPEIRVGFRGDSSCQPTGVELGITAQPGGEQTGCTGFHPVADHWYCFELHVIQAGATVTTDLAIDGVDQSYAVHGTPSDTVVGTGFSGGRFLKVGTRSYSSAFTVPIYVDDLAVATQRPGCP